MSRLRNQEGFALVVGIMAMVLMLSIGLVMYTFVDSQARQSAYERDGESAYNYAEGLMDIEGYMVSSSWPAAAPGMPDCTFNGTTLTATGGPTSLCPATAQLAATFTGNDYAGTVSWTARIRDNGGTDQCAVIAASTCSYYYDDAGLSSQPSYDANGDGQVWVRAQALARGKRRTVVERITLDKQPVNFPQAVITAGYLTLKDSPHVKVVTNYSPIYLRCAINSSGCLTLKKLKQIAPYKITYSYAQQTAIPTSSLNQLRTRAQAEGWYYSTCPTSPPGSQVFVESGSCTGTSMPYTSPTQRGTYIQASGTLTITGKKPASANYTKGRKGNFWGLIYLANQGHLTSNVLTVNKGRRLIRGVVAIDYGGGMSLGGSKDTLLQYDPVAFQGLYLYQGSSIVRPSFRDIVTNTP
jgi:Tfp pilus assembly protein PilX